ncbi:hypothetical protein PAMA_003606 [Pampus argenteus]
MLFFIFCFHVVVVVKGLSDAPPAPPQDVRFVHGLLNWTSAEDRDITYTVQYSTRFSKPAEWTDVPACVQTSLNYCDVSFTKAAAEHGCVKLRVRAERRGLTSAAASTCSTHNDSCTPDVRLTVRPGYLTVHLSRNHDLAREYADHGKHRVYITKEGEDSEEHLDTVSSMTLSGLEEGRRYCARVQYIYMGNPVGLSSCSVCHVIPTSSTNHTHIIVAVVAVIILVVMILTVYILLYQRKRIKQWLRPPYEIPENVSTNVIKHTHTHTHTQPAGHTV